MPSLLELYRLAGAARPDKPPSYLRCYQTLFAELVAGRLLEIGVQSGNSLRLWAQLPCFQLVAGVDRDSPSRADFPKHVRFFQGDQTDRDLLSRIGVQCGPFDVIIDDASHDAALTDRTFEILFPYVKPGGHFVIEDIAAFQTEASLAAPGEAGISFGLIGLAKRLLDRMVPTAIGIGLSPFTQMTFYPNMVVITKAAPPGINHVD